MRDYYDSRLSPRAIATSAAYLGGRFGVKVQAGNKWECDVSTKTLRYPSHELEKYTRVEAVALLMHEIGHAADSSPLVYEKGQRMVDRFGKELTSLAVNAFEDWRIDYLAAKRYTNGEEIIEEMNRQACASNRRDLYDVGSIDALIEYKKTAHDALLEYQTELAKSAGAPATAPLGVPDSPAAVRAIYRTYNDALTAHLKTKAQQPNLDANEIMPAAVEALLKAFPAAEETRVRAALDKLRDDAPYSSIAMPIRAAIEQPQNVPAITLIEAVVALSASADQDDFARVVRAIKKLDDDAMGASPTEKARQKYETAQRKYSAGAIKRVLLTASLMAYGEDMPRPIKPTAWKRGGAGKAAKWRRDAHGWVKTVDDDDDYYSSWYAELDAKAEERYMLSLDLWERASMIVDEMQLPIITADSTGAVYKLATDKAAPILWDLVADDVQGESMDTGSEGTEAAGQRMEAGNTRKGYDTAGTADDGRVDWGAARKAVRKDAAATFAKIRRMVQENARQRFAGRFTSGRLNKAKLWKAGVSKYAAGAGDTRLFQRRVERRNYDFAASIMIDVSGSMDDLVKRGGRQRRYEAAVEAAALIADAVAEARGKVEIIAFSTSADRGVRFGEKVRDEHVSRFINRVYGGGTNIDLATAEAVQSLEACASEKKALFVITDADLLRGHYIDADAYCYQVGGSPRERVYRDASKHYVVRDRRGLVDRVARDVKRFTSGK